MRSELWANTRIVCIPLQTSRGGVVQPQSASYKRARARAGLELLRSYLSLSLLSTVHQARELLLKNKNGE